MRKITRTCTPAAARPQSRTPWLICATLLVSYSAASQEGGAINAERPGFSSSPVVLAPSALQVEMGYEYVREGGSAGFDSHTLPLALLRVGLVDRLELQFSWAGYSRFESSGFDASGVTDASIGVKWELNGPDTAVPIALFAGLSLPVGDDEFSSDDVDPRLGVFWSHSAGVDWFGTAILSEADGELSVANALGVNLPVSNNTGGYVEYFGLYGDGGPEHFLNGGLAYTPRRDLQLDVNAGAGLNGRAADFFFGFGLAYRF